MRRACSRKRTKCCRGSPHARSMRCPPTARSTAACCRRYAVHWRRCRAVCRPRTSSTAEWRMRCCSSSLPMMVWGRCSAADREASGLCLRRAQLIVARDVGGELGAYLVLLRALGADEAVLAFDLAAQIIDIVAQLARHRLARRHKKHHHLGGRGGRGGGGAGRGRRRGGRAGRGGGGAGAGGDE